MAGDPASVLFRDSGGIIRKICRVAFGRDGSYYVTTPYHRDKSATLMKVSVDYDGGEQTIATQEDIVDIADLDDERVKFTHHRSGLCQFSGKGVSSGVDSETGEIRGVGVYSSPLEDVGAGPAFGLVLHEPDLLDEVKSEGSGDLLLNADSTFSAERGANQTLVIEGHYFQPELRRFLVDDGGVLKIRYVHPWRMCILEMPVLLAWEGCQYPGFVGIDAFWRSNESGASGFTLSGPSGNVRIDQYGHRRGDSIMCAYPKWDVLPHGRNLNYPPKAPPSSAAELRKGHPGA